MVQYAGSVVPVSPNPTSPVLSLSDAELAACLWKLDSYQAQLESIRDAITQDLDFYQTESVTLRQQKTAMQAAAVAGRPPLKTKLGE
jgi:hypothetical protein